MTILSGPRVSVCIPTFNSALYLAEALESVLAQDFDDYEVVIVDDGSSDASRKIASDYTARDSRIRCFANRATLGISGNCNRCMELARGTYIKFLFADDILWSPSTLTHMIRVMDAFPRVALVACGRRIIDAQSRHLYDKVSYPDGLQCGGKLVARHCLADLKNRIGEPTAVMFRRRTGRQGFRPDYCQLLDLEMWLRLLAEGDFHYLAEPLVGFRYHDRQATRVNRRTLAYLSDYRMIIRCYATDKSAGLGFLGRWLVRLQHCEKIWRLHAKKKLLDKARAKEEIGYIMAPCRFFLLRPWHLLIFRKILHPWYVRCLSPRSHPAGMS
jgi:glycosyltransferase involved in cell wall biosynthesis